MINAIYKLYPQVVNIIGDVATDADGNEVAYDKDAVQAYVDANAYKTLRAKAYPSFADQFDTLFHEGIDAWKAQIHAVKDRFPNE